MAYAQTNYPQIQGINGKYSIASIGCFITAFCNLEADFGQNIDPLTFNNIYRDNGWFVDVDDGIRDDLDWGFIQRWDSNTRVTQIGGAGWPNTNQAIVKFAYTHNGKRNTHFCKVQDSSNQIILDSWDGVAKHISATWYGQPVAWATYEHSAPQAVIAPEAVPTFTVVEEYPGGKQIQLNKQPTNLWGMNYSNPGGQPPVEVHNAGEIWTVTNKVHHVNGYDYYRREGQIDGFNVLDCDDYVEPVPEPVPYIPPAAPVPVTRAETYTLLTALPYYDAPQVAINRGKQTGALPAGIYYVWGKEGRAYNLSTSNMTNEGRWVDTIENKAPVVVPVTVIPKPLPQQPVADNTWKTTRSWFYPDRAKYDLYELQEDTVVKDLDNRGKDWYVNAVETDKTGQSDNTILRVHGTVYKDGVKYYLLHPPKDVNWEYWYVIPVTNKHTGKAYLLKWPDTYATTPKKNQVTAGDEAIAAIMKVGYKIFDVLSPRKIREWLNNK